MSAILALGRLRQEDGGFEASLRYTVRPRCLQKSKKELTPIFQFIPSNRRHKNITMIPKLD
jgi:hypothetical protein